MISTFGGEKDMWTDSTTGRKHGDGTCSESIGGCGQVLYNAPAVWIPVGSRGDGGYWDIVCNSCTRAGVAAGFKSRAA